MILFESYNDPQFKMPSTHSVRSDDIEDEVITYEEEMEELLQGQNVIQEACFWI